MNRYYRRIYFSLLLGMLLTLLPGCYTDFEPDLESTPVVCLNSLITAGEEIRVEVTRTWRYSEGNPVTGLDINLMDAEVSLFVNDKFEETLTLIPDTDPYKPVKSNFVAKYVPKSGDRLKLRAVDKRYGEAEAEITLPYPVEIDEVKTRIKRNKASYDAEDDIFTSDFDLVLTVYLTDPADVSNYYIFDMPTYKSIRYETDDPFTYVPIAESIRISPDYSIEPIFSEHITPIETIISDAYGLYTMFSDRQFSGAQYSLEIPVNGFYRCDFAHHPDLENKLSMDVKLGHITTEYYKYMLSLWAVTEGVSGALGGVGLGDAVFEFSNVSTGAGIVAGQAVATAPINLYELLTQKL